MKTYGKQRLFEVMGRLDKSFKPKLNEDDRSDFQQKIQNGDVWLEYYGPSGSKEYTDGENWYNRGGQSLRDPQEYDRGGEGYTPFGDEGDGMYESTDSNSEFLPISAPEGSPDDKLFMDVVNQGIDSSLEGFTKSKFEIKNGSLGNRRIFNFHKSELPIVLRRLEDMGTPEAQQWKQDIEDYEKNVGEISEEITTGKGNSAEGLIFDFPGHARQSNPVDSPQYQWYVKVLNFVNGNNNVYEKAELIEFFQNNFIGMDYDVLQTPAEAVSWWLSPEQQEFIKDELNS
jgi:hypothetical protein